MRKETKKDGNLKGKKAVFTTVHIIAVIFLVLSLCGMIYAVDGAGGSIYEIFRETNASAKPEETDRDQEDNKETFAKTTETKASDKQETEKETKTISGGQTDLSYQDEAFRAEFYKQIQEAIEYTWYVRAFEGEDGEIDVNKVAVSGPGQDADDQGFQYRIRDLIQYSERYGTYDRGRIETPGDAFADYYWNTLLKVSWCSFDLTFDLEDKPGAPVAYENKLVGITSVFNERMERYLELKEKFTKKDNGLFFTIAYHMNDGPADVVVTNHEQPIDYTKLDTYFVLNMPDSEVDTNLPGYSLYDLPEITDTAHMYKISAQPVYTITAGWADSKAALSEAMEAANAAALKESEEAAKASEAAAQQSGAGASEPADVSGEANESKPADKSESPDLAHGALETSKFPTIPDLNSGIDREQQAFYKNLFTSSLASLIGALILSVATLVWLIFNTGKVVTDGEEKYALSGMDLWYWEVSLLVVIGFVLFWNWLPVIHSSRNPLSVSRIVGWLGTYFIILTGGLSFVRRMRVGKLTDNSLLKVAGNQANQALRLFSENQKPVTRLIVAFVIGTIIHVLAMWWMISSLKAYGAVREGRYLIQIIAAALVLIILYGTVLTALFRKAVQRQKVLNGVGQISHGRLEQKIDLEGLTGDDRILADSINHIGDGLSSAVSTATKSERMKTELITNVSHDIKTPLTSIINYVDLLKRENIRDPKVNNYIHVLDQKSQRLKNLIEDLVEASKASSGNVALELEKIDFCQLVKQIDGEFQVRFQEGRLQMVTTVPENSIYINADGRRVWRILENLYQNALKYAMKDSRVYIGVVPYNNTVSFVMKNISASPLNFEAQELTERFIRGDVARTTEGSGLGLSIAKDLTELHGGEFQVYLDGDLFKVSVTFQTCTADN